MTDQGPANQGEVFRDETYWLTQARMAELFGSISYHLRNIFASRELTREATVQETLTVQNEGGREVSRGVEHYNLDAVNRRRIFPGVRDGMRR